MSACLWAVFSSHGEGASYGEESIAKNKQTNKTATASLHPPFSPLHSSVAHPSPLHRALNSLFSLFSFHFCKTALFLFLTAQLSLPIFLMLKIIIIIIIIIKRLLVDFGWTELLFYSTLCACQTK
jgi:hypothetical protein